MPWPEIRVGFEAYLHTVYAALQARRVIDRRCHETDRNKTQWPPVAMMIMDADLFLWVRLIPMALTENATATNGPVTGLAC